MIELEKKLDNLLIPYMRHSEREAVVKEIECILEREGYIKKSDIPHELLLGEEEIEKITASEMKEFWDISPETKKVCNQLAQALYNAQREILKGER